MNQPEEGEKNLEQAYRYYKAYMHEPKFKLLDFTTCIIDVYSISSMFNGKETLKEQLKWTDRCDSLLTWYSQQPGADSSFVEKMEGMNSLNRAEILYDQDKKAEADMAFEKFLETSYSKGDEGRFLSCTYLAKSGRYTWAADIYQDLDLYASMWGMKPNMEFITGFLFTKFRYNYQAGRKDSAFAVAVKIAELIDSASVKQKEDAAAELTTIYETQKKEATSNFCNAGHNPPVLVNSGRADFLEMVPIAPIGLWPGLEFEGEEIDTIKGSPLFIYTDGLNEAENSQQEQFGDHRLLNMLRQIQYSSARQVVETMAEAVTQHRNGADPNDDLTMMCIHYFSS